MESIVARLSNEELEVALTESKGQFTKVLLKRRDYISDLKLSSNSSRVSPQIYNNGYYRKRRFKNQNIVDFRT